MDKYRLLRRHVSSSDLHANDVLVVPPAATDEQLSLCHTVDYIDKVQNGTLSDAEIRRIGFPWSPKLVERSRRSTGATIAAARAALADGVAANLAGGTHHAFADAGEGYCVFNDAAVAIRTMQHEGLISCACVIDLDVHQGNGTAAILANDATVFTLSIHGVKNFPIRKMPSDLDVSLPDGTQDDQYMESLVDSLEVLNRWMQTNGRFEIAVYLAGADPFQDDRLGRLALTKAGLERRDQAVMQWCHDQNIPFVVAMAGGYAENVNDIVDIHASTLALASQYCLLRS